MAHSCDQLIQAAVDANLNFGFFTALFQRYGKKNVSTVKAVVVPVTPLQQNCTVIWCEETMKGAAVDPGGDIDRIIDAAKQHGVTLEKILITHAHLDHAGGAAALSEKLDIPIEGPHEDDQFWIDKIESSGAQFGITDAKAFVPSRWLHGGDTVKFGNAEMDVYHTPGHTPGHIVFHHPESKIALVGDVLFQGSIGRTDFPMGSFDQLIESITQQLWPLGNDTSFVSGHGAMSTFGMERKMNPFVADMALGTNQ